MKNGKLFNLKASPAWRAKVEAAAKNKETSSSQFVRDCVNDCIRALVEQDQKLAQEIARIERTASKAA
jgi:hypothetical protein